MKVLAASFGSAGDFLPTLAIVKALHDEGHEVVVVSNPFHESAVRRAGLAFVPAGTYVDLFAELETNPTYLDRLSGSKRLWEDFGRPYVSTTYTVMGDYLDHEGADAVVASNLSQGAFWAAMQRRVPTIMVSATPMWWISADAPMQFMDRRLPDWALPRASAMVTGAARWLSGRWLRELARALGLNDVDPTVTGIERALTLHIGTWSKVVRTPPPNEPPANRTCGFVRAGHLGANATLSDEVRAFLEAGPPPIVVGFGSAFSIIGGSVLTEVAAACAELGKRCLIVGRPSAEIQLPGETLAVKYAPYHLVFPRAEAVVIHGGAGTTGEALRGGRPTVVVPFGYDQYSLAWRVEELGAGVRVAKSKRDRVRLVEAIARASSDASIAERAKVVSAQLAGEPDGAGVAARTIAALFQGANA